MIRRLCTLVGAFLVGLSAAGAAAADPELVSPSDFSGVLDLRAAAADGERSWLDGGFGKLRFGGGDDAVRGRLALADAALAWRPRLTWDLSAVIDGEVQKLGDYHADLIQAYLAYKPVPRGPLRFSARLGLFYPQISEEHGGPAWEVADTITPSAVNTWVGEEVKVVGAEATVSRTFGGHQLSATGAVFGYDDTSGTLLTFRGWALDDVKAGAVGEFSLPPLEQQYLLGQPRETYSLREIDNRLGYYGRVEWRPPAPVSFNAFYYDNRGDLTGVDGDVQWAWATRFWNLGAVWTPDDRTRVLSQVLSGETLMGFPNGRSVWFNLGFTSAYLLATRTYGRSAFTARIEFFETRDRNFRPALDGADQNWGETGWALTGAYRLALNAHASLFVEALHIESDRPSRGQAGLAAWQSQTQVQTSLRLSF